MRVDPSRRKSISCFEWTSPRSNDGGRTLKRMSEVLNTESLVVTVAPAALYSSSRNCALTPHPLSTRTSRKPLDLSTLTFAGVKATRSSPGKDSATTPTDNWAYGMPATKKVNRQMDDRQRAQVRPPASLGSTTSA